MTVTAGLDLSMSTSRGFTTVLNDAAGYIVQAPLVPSRAIWLRHTG